MHVRRHRLSAGLAACAALVLLVGGCSSDRIRDLGTQQEFVQLVLRSDFPVMVEFYKGACPTCVALEPMMNQLAEEYKGRVRFVRFELMKPYFEVTSDAIKHQYDITVFPTEVLFVGGKEAARWPMNYDMDGYRSVLNRVAGRPRDYMM